MDFVANLWVFSESASQSARSFEKYEGEWRYCQLPLVDSYLIKEHSWLSCHCCFGIVGLVRRIIAGSSCFTSDAKKVSSAFDWLLSWDEIDALRSRAIAVLRNVSLFVSICHLYFFRSTPKSPSPFISIPKARSHLPTSLMWRQKVHLPQRVQSWNF